MSNLDMRKIVSYLGIALLVAGVSSTVSSCQKENAIEKQGIQEVVEAQPIDFSEITKSDLDEPVNEATEDVKEAIEDIIQSLVKQLGEGAEAHQAAIDKLEAGLFNIFTSFTAYHDFDEYYSELKLECPSDFFNMVSHFSFTIFDAEQDDVEESYIEVEFEDNKIHFETENGNFIDFLYPDLNITKKINKLIQITCDCATRIEIGNVNNDYLFASADFQPNATRTTEFNLDNLFGTAEISIYDENGTIGGVEYEYGLITNIIYPGTYTAWYDNVNEGEAPIANEKSSIEIKNIPEIIEALGYMTYTYKYSKDEAEKYESLFNDNVCEYVEYDEETNKKYRAVIGGKKFYAEVAVDKNSAKKNLYNVLLYWGDQVVDTESVIEFLEDHFDYILN